MAWHRPYALLCGNCLEFSSKSIFTPIVPRPRDDRTQFSIVPKTCDHRTQFSLPIVPKPRNHRTQFSIVPNFHRQSCPYLTTTVPSSQSCPVLATTYESPTLKTTSDIIPLWPTTFNEIYFHSFWLRTKQAAHRLKILFGLAGFEATELHGNLTQVQFLDALELFRKQQVYFLISTDVTARDLMEKTIVLALATGQKRFSVTLCKFVEKYAEILASQGQLTMALEYVKLLGSEELTHELVILKDQISLSTESDREAKYGSRIMVVRYLYDQPQLLFLFVDNCGVISCEFQSSFFVVTLSLLAKRDDSKLKSRIVVEQSIKKWSEIIEQMEDQVTAILQEESCIPGHWVEPPPSADEIWAT
uniref:Uncharacterized protein n=1 Tax=Cucumis melo TaxID=3656 RepID=A0A9I9E7S0_CUCME